MVLAINGGEKIAFEKWPQWPQWDQHTLNALEEVLNSGRWAISGQWTGSLSKCEQFEKMYANYNKISHCAVFDHGSSSLVAALEALEIGPGDEVIVPALTWVASIICICTVNAIPVIVDIDEQTYCISIDAVEKAITPKTKAIIPVHLYGCMTDMDRLNAVAKKHDLYIIEDASHSHGSVWNESYAGTIGDIGCFSFQQGKVMTSGEGGAAITNSKKLASRLFEIRTNSRIYLEQKKSSLQKTPLKENGEILGTNYCISEFQAAVLLEQLKMLDVWNRIKEENAIYLNNRLNEIPGITPMYRHPQVDKQSYYRFCIKIDTTFFHNKNTLQIAEALEAELGFPVEQPYAPLHKTPLYKPHTLKNYYWSNDYINKLKTQHLSYPIAEKASFNEGIIFHHSILLGSKEQMDIIVTAFEKVKYYSDTL